MGRIAVEFEFGVESESGFGREPLPARGLVVGMTGGGHVGGTCFCTSEVSRAYAPRKRYLPRLRLLLLRLVFSLLCRCGVFRLFSLSLTAPGCRGRGKRLSRPALGALLRLRLGEGEQAGCACGLNDDDGGRGGRVATVVESRRGEREARLFLDPHHGWERGQRERSGACGLGKESSSSPQVYLLLC
jgi:hypothetical protein